MYATWRWETRRRVRSLTASARARKSPFSTACVWGAGPQVDVRLPGKGNSNSHGARPVHRLQEAAISQRQSES